jgi:hypothetical protein
LRVAQNITQNKEATHVIQKIIRLSSAAERPHVYPAVFEHTLALMETEKGKFVVLCALNNLKDQVKQDPVDVANCAAVVCQQFLRCPSKLIDWASQYFYASAMVSAIELSLPHPDAVELRNRVPPAHLHKRYHDRPTPTPTLAVPASHTPTRLSLPPHLQYLNFML